MLRIGPGVGEVVVQVDAVAFFVEPLCEVDGVGEVVAAVGGIYPEPGFDVSEIPEVWVFSLTATAPCSCRHRRGCPRRAS